MLSKDRAACAPLEAIARAQEMERIESSFMESRKADYRARAESFPNFTKRSLCRVPGCFRPPGSIQPAGSVISKRIDPSAQEARIAPPCASMIDRVIASPNPAPSPSLRRAGSTR